MLCSWDHNSAPAAAAAAPIFSLAIPSCSCYLPYNCTLTAAASLWFTQKPDAAAYNQTLKLLLLTTSEGCSHRGYMCN